LNRSRADEGIPSVRVVVISTSHDKGDEVDFLVAYSSRILEDDRAALRWAPEVEGGVVERCTLGSAETAAGIFRPVDGCAANEGGIGGEEGLHSREESKTYDVSDG
jgi:hypothetical protein